MSAIKVSISLDELDIAYLDQQAREGAFPSRSAAVQEAIRLLRESGLADSYAEAFASWHEDVAVAGAWDAAVGDGITAT